MASWNWALNSLKQAQNFLWLLQIQSISDIIYKQIAILSFTICFPSNSILSNFIFTPQKRM